MDAQTTIKQEFSGHEGCVTFKWLIGTSLSTLAIVVTLFGIMSAYFTNVLQSKVNLDLYASQHKVLCSDIEDIKRVVESNQKTMYRMDANQILVLRALKIDPVR